MNTKGKLATPNAGEVHRGATIHINTKENSNPTPVKCTGELYHRDRTFKPLSIK